MATKKYDVIIIGAGLGGLVSAAALAVKGKKILLLEKGHMVGGYQIFFKRDKFIIEPCLHICAEAGEGNTVRQILAALDLADVVEFSRFDPVSQFVFPDGAITIPSDYRSYIELLKNKFPEEADGIDSVFNDMNSIYQGLKKFPEIEPIVEEYASKPFHSLLAKYVKNERLQTIIGGYAAYFGLPLSQISTLLLCGFSAAVIFEGGYMPKGGIKKLVASIENRIKELGGEIRLRSSVKEIIVQGGKAAGVILESGDRFEAGNIISNVDVTTTFFNLVGEENLPSEFTDRLRKLQPSDSAFNVFLGVKSRDLRLDELPEAIVVFPDYDLEGQYQAMLKGELERSNFSIGIPTKTNPAFAPEGHDVIILFAPLPYRLEGVDWKENKSEFTQRLIDLAEKVIPGLKDNIVMTEAASPATLFRYTGNTGGAVGGWAYTPESDALRPENKTPVEGLYLAGHWTIPGVATNNVIKSGWLTASMID